MISAAFHIFLTLYQVIPALLFYNDVHSVLYGDT